MSTILKYGDKGEPVKVLQRLLNHNAYRRPRKLLEVDGEFGPLTAASIQGTKFWMGYAKGDIEPIAGDFFMALIKNGTPLPGDYDNRRKARLANVIENYDKKAALDKMRRRVLARIKDELGTLEQPHNSNHIKYNTYWGWGPVPYCVIGISWAWLMEGSKAFVRGSRWANTDAMLSDAKMGDHGIHLTNDPDPGCPGVIDFDGHSDPDHAITFVKDNGNGTCETYEFNTRKDSTYIEGVFNKSRPLRNCWWFEVEL